MRFVGVDLAWSPRNASGAVVLDWDGTTGRPRVWESALGGDAEVLSFIAQGVGEESALVAIDAPLVVPNEGGMRPCDRTLSQRYRQSEAGAYPANRARLGPEVRGEILVARLGGLGFAHAPAVRRQAATRQVVEVYPHPGMVELFGLEKTLKYKARRDRPSAVRWEELERLKGLLASLARGEPAMEADRLLAGITVRGLRGRELKRVEDLFDALFCAHIALHLWYWGETGYRCFGDLNTGYILVPIQPAN
ncbi:MAG: DUF429 domain-containing protein [Candidatus Bipolaricaulis sp.]